MRCQKFLHHGFFQPNIAFSPNQPYMMCLMSTHPYTLSKQCLVSQYYLFMKKSMRTSTSWWNFAFDKKTLFSNFNNRFDGRKNSKKYPISLKSTWYDTKLFHDQGIYLQLFPCFRAKRENFPIGKATIPLVLGENRLKGG